jgi:hypothetical protein
LKIGDPKTGGPHGPLVARRKVLRDEMDALRQEQSKGKSSRGKLLDQVKAANDSVQRKVSCSFIDLFLILSMWTFCMLRNATVLATK